MLKQSNLAKYMNFSKKNKSTNKGKYKTAIPNYIDSYSYKYPNYLQSSINDDIFLLKRKLKGYSKIHSHSSNNSNKNIEINKNNNKMPMTSHINAISPINNYINKKKVENNNYINKSSKNHLMLTSVNNSSIIYNSKDRGLSYSNNNGNNASNYQSNNHNNFNNNLYNLNKKNSFKNNNANNSYQKKNSLENEVYIPKNINMNNNIINQYEKNNNIIVKKNVKDKKYSLTSINNKKNSIDKEREKERDREIEREKEETDIIKKLKKLNFTGLFNNYNDNKRIIHSSKVSANNSGNNSIINNNNNINNNINSSNNSNINNKRISGNKINKNLFIGEFFNIKKKEKFDNNFLDNYYKGPQSSNNRKNKKDMNIINNNSNINYNILNNGNNNNANSIANNTISKNNNFSSSHYSPINGNKFYKTAKISPRSSFPKKNQEIVQSHRINLKNKLSGNILSFYNNYKNNSNNINNNVNNGSLYGNSYNMDNNLNYKNKLNEQINKKSKKNNMSVNMNITYNNKNFDMSNFKISNTNKNKNISYNNKSNNFNKSSSLNKIKNNNFISNYNNFNLNYINNMNNNHNNSFINKKEINTSALINNKQYNNDNQILNGNNIINNCEININNINYNNYNYNPNIIQNNNNKYKGEKIYNFFNKKALLEVPNNKINKLFSQSQKDIVQMRKKGKNYTSINSPINNNMLNNKDLKIKNKNLNNSKNNSSTKIIKNPLINFNNSNYTNSSQNNINNNLSVNMYFNKNNSNKSNQIKKMLLQQKENTNNNSKENVNINKLLVKEQNLVNNNILYDFKNEKNIEKKEKKNRIEEYNNYNKDKIKSSNILENELREILELKNNLQKNIVKDIKATNDESKNSKENDNPNQKTISNMSSTTHDSNYYMEKCNSLSKYIKNYYKKYNTYPNTDLNFYLYGRLIGQGAFGKVNIGLNILTGRVVAIKSFNKKNLNKNGDNMKKILYETNLMKKLNHPNITKILEMFEDDEYILISMEYINGGNLFSFVKKRRKLSEKTAKFLFRQIILGIKHIHSQKIVHRDIKLENILIDLNNNIKICDFGIGRILTSKKQMLHDKCGTPMYMAPEILLSSKSKGYEGFPVDIWSSGISLYIMLSGTLPFNLKNNQSSSIDDEENNNNLELQYSIINKEPKKIEKISDEARDLLRGLLNKNPNKRLTIDEILNHPWLKSDEKNIKNNKKYHLFTKAEMIMLSKTYIDYRTGIIDDLKENFTISNLKIEKNDKSGEKKIKNITTKSSLLAPYNTLIQDNDSILDYEIEDSFDDLSNPNINLENDIIIYNNKVKEYNLNYELNNNGECDNGMLINTKTGTISSSAANNSNIKNEGQLTNRSRQRYENEGNNDLDEDFNDNEDQEEEQEKKIEKILDEIEKIGYDKKYVLNCVNNNILCHASTVFYLMLNYKNI